MLFCKEFNRPLGISRYKNQSGIETNPIEKDGEMIAWQAKFYDKALSAHKKEILETLKTVKRNYPSVTRLIFYSNQDWGQNKGKKPKGEIEVENSSNTLGIKLEWRTSSYFESSFVASGHELISKHFFSLDKSTLDLIQEQKTHTDAILNQIQTQIVFKGQAIEIDRSIVLKELLTDVGRVVILSGVGGVGKTALLKKFYALAKETASVYVFKATEFELRDVKEIFSGHSFIDFINAHKNEGKNIAVIDSAEKLMDLRNTDPFKEFLSVLVQNNWGIIFTVRDSYLEGLNYQFLEIYKIAPINIHIQNLEFNELNRMAEQYSFLLPKAVKLLELIKNPFYLNEYLQVYREDAELEYPDFKNALWRRIIEKAKPAREQCFLKTAFEHVKEGQFFINPDCESSILDELQKDGILGYESPHGYFITHDIYEEWALEKIIEDRFLKKANAKAFFLSIGSPLAMRRAFRKWLSEKLLLHNGEIKSFIQDILKDSEIASFWKDEALVSVLRSDYSAKYFEFAKTELLANNQELLKKLTFLLRIACKEIDLAFFRRLGIININPNASYYVPTVPKGAGWENLIKFVYENLRSIGIENISFVLPVIYDWSSQNKEGSATRFSGLIALEYYKWLIKKDVHFHNEEPENHVFQTISNSAATIKSELEQILNEILANKWKNYRDPYYDFAKFILKRLEGIPISKTLPKHVLLLADMFWSYTPRRSDERYGRSDIGMEQCFNIESDGHNYFPASSFQTPIFWLLQSSLSATIKFILEFTNKAAECYARSDMGRREVSEVEVHIDDGKPIKQLISNRLWCLYRGTQVGTYLLESMHMALEKYFLETGEHIDSSALESWLLYLLKNSRSASITAVVTSIVLAYPEKTFNVARILFRTKELFHFDTARYVLDQTQKSSLSMLKGFIPKNEIYNSERLKACDAPQRKLALEHIFLKYLMFRSKEVTEQESENRQKMLWKILDAYYKELPAPDKETDDDKTWRLFLARMDKRRMKIATEKTKEGIVFHLNPEIDPKLKEHSEEFLGKVSESMKYSALSMWASYKMDNDERYKQYQKYETNPKLAFKELREIISKLGTEKKQRPYELEPLEQEGFYLYNHSAPSEICSVLLRDYLEHLSNEEKTFCKDYALKVAYSFLVNNDPTLPRDGGKSITSVLPVLFETFPEEKERIKLLLLCLLFNEYPIDASGTPFAVFAINAIYSLWERNFEDAQSLLYGYLRLSPEWDTFRERLRKENCKKGIYNQDLRAAFTQFLATKDDDLERLVKNELSIRDIGVVEKLDLDILRTAFQLLHLKANSLAHKDIAKKIIVTFSKQMTSQNRADKVDYRVGHDFLKRLAYLVLNSSKEDAENYISPFIDRFDSSEVFANLFREFILAEDAINAHDVFWHVWHLFNKKVVGSCKKGEEYGYIGQIIRSYLFAQIPWNEEISEWHTLKDTDAVFFENILKQIGQCPSTLYAISRLLNGIGSRYLSEGVSWISDALQKNTNLADEELKADTIYYLESIIKKFAYRNRERIRKTKKLKQDVLVILDYMISKGSVVGYMTREDIL